MFNVVSKCAYGFRKGYKEQEKYEATLKSQEEVPKSDIEFHKRRISIYQTLNGIIKKIVLIL